MQHKPDKQFLFETGLSLIDERKAVLASAGAEGNIYVETPPAFGGTGKSWSPEHLFIGSVSSCFMLTFLGIAGKMRITLRGLKCPAIGQVGWAEGHYRFTQIDLYPEIFVEEACTHLVPPALEKSYKHCLVAKSLALPVFYHSQVKTGPVEGEQEKWLSLPLEGNSRNIII